MMLTLQRTGKKEGTDFSGFSEKELVKVASSRPSHKTAES